MPLAAGSYEVIGKGPGVCRGVFAPGGVQDGGLARLPGLDPGCRRAVELAGRLRFTRPRHLTGSSAGGAFPRLAASVIASASACAPASVRVNVPARAREAAALVELNGGNAQKPVIHRRRGERVKSDPERTFNRRQLAVAAKQRSSHGRHLLSWSQRSQAWRPRTQSRPPEPLRRGSETRRCSPDDRRPPPSRVR